MKSRELVLPKSLVPDAETQTDRYGRYVAEPFERGYGHTIGSALRRVLLSSLEGASVTTVKFRDALHEFTTIPGVVEDVTNILLNLKLVRFRMHSEGPEHVTLHVRREGVVTAGDLQCGPSLEVLNPEQPIATLDTGGELEAELTVSRGRGYVPADSHRRENLPIGTLPVDAIFSPVTRVHYDVENARVGQITDFDRLVLEIWTDGSIAPGDALSFAAKILRGTLGIFLLDGEAAVSAGASDGEAAGEGIREIMTRPIEHLKLSVRSVNCLKSAKIRTLGDLVRRRDEELLNFQNFGEKSLDEVKEKLQELGLTLGMADVTTAEG